MKTIMVYESPALSNFGKSAILLFSVLLLPVLVRSKGVDIVGIKSANIDIKRAYTWGAAFSGRGRDLKWKVDPPSTAPPPPTCKS